jgi:2-polyprenyl-3-methyl-5-hydroxy-6-metoxy-1,4-benzoquinol methylase
VETNKCPACGKEESQLLRRTAFPGEPAWFRCAFCSTEFLSPQPDESRLSEIYGPSYYEPWSWEEPDIVQETKARTFLKALDVAAPRPGSRLLDVGCAQGELAAAAATIGLQVAGVDLNPEAIRRARDRVPDGAFFCGQIEAAANWKWDIVTMFDFIEHVREPIETLRHAASLLDTSGSLLLSTPRTDSFSRHILRRAWPQYREEHLVLFSFQGLRTALRQAGLTVERTSTTVKFTTGAYMMGQVEAYSPPWIKYGARHCHCLKRVRLMHRPIPLRFGEMLVLARKSS